MYKISTSEVNEVESAVAITFKKSTTNVDNTWSTKKLASGHVSELIMGKGKKKPRYRDHVSVREEDIMEDNKEDVLNVIMEQLRDPSAGVRECGCVSLARMAWSASSVLERKLVRVVAPLIVDESVDVRRSALDAVTNLANADDSLAEAVVMQDVLTPLCALMTKHHTPPWLAGSPNLELDTVPKVFVLALKLMTHLLQTAPKALEVLSRRGEEDQQRLLHVLLLNIDHLKHEPTLMVPLLQCLQVLSDDAMSTTLAKSLHCSETLCKFRNLLNSDVGAEDEVAKLHVQLLTSSLLLVLSNGTNESEVDSLRQHVVKCASLLLQRDQRRLANEFSSVCPLNNDFEPEFKAASNGKGSNGDNTDVDMMEIADTVDSSNPISHQDNVGKLQNCLAALVDAQLSSLEIITNLCCSKNENEEIVDDDSNDESNDEDYEDVIEVDDDQKDLDPFIIASLSEHKLVELVFDKTQNLAVNVEEILSTQKSGQGLLVRLKEMQNRALLCLNNLIDNLGTEDLGGEEKLFQMWTEVGKTCFSDSSQNKMDDDDNNNKNDYALIEAATSALRAMTNTLVASKCKGFEALTEQDLHQMLSLGQRHSWRSVRINLVQILGSVGALMVELKPDSSGSLAIASFLINVASSDNQGWVRAEALDKLFDMFSDDNSNQLAKKIDLVAKMRQMGPGLKAKIASQKNELIKSDAWPVVQMAKDNLNRFVKYKQKCLARTS